MKELTDLEICQRIAEIEGKPHVVDCEKLYVTGEMFGTDYRELFSPLTNDALCFKLMLRHEVSLTYGDYAVNAEILVGKEDGDHSFDSQAYCPKRAICLAIIKSKEGT
jgi:hypothetical protein